MATLDELYQLHSSANAGIRTRVVMATVVAAEGVRTENPATPNHAKRLLWAREVFQNPEVAGVAMTWAVLAQNAAVPLATIIAASDAQVQSAVEAAIDVFAQ